MNAEPIHIDEFLQKAINLPVADVRTPKEYTHGHIPGAKLFSLFSNEERAEVGKMYALMGKEKALERGYDIAGARMIKYVEQASEIAMGHKILLYCWRGGMRSSSLAWLLGFSGFEVHMLEGGYKSYRRYMHDLFRRKIKLIVIGGYTGSGKTAILKSLEKSGEQVINLESFASHKGSVFGWIGEADQPSQEQFENDLGKALREIDINRRVWIEDESINIGRIQVPRDMFDQMHESPMILVETAREARVERLVKDYNNGSIPELRECFLRIRKRLGGLKTTSVIEAIEKGDFHTAADCALDYYDKAYQQLMMKRKSNLLKPIDFSGNESETAKNIIAIADRMNNL
jgi:tRNA 2-selenouridine synthase